MRTTAFLYKCFASLALLCATATNAFGQNDADYYGESLGTDILSSVSAEAVNSKLNASGYNNPIRNVFDGNQNSYWMSSR